MPITLPTDTRYGSPTSLNFSSIKKFVKYDSFGTPTYNISGYLNAPPFSVTDAILIGRIVDEILTENLDFDSHYKLSTNKTVDEYKAELQDEAKARWLSTSKWKKDDWQEFRKEIYGEEPQDNREELSTAVYNTCQYVIDSHMNFQYDKNRTIYQFWIECDTQKVVESNGRKGKLDFYHPTEKIVWDLKIVWSLDNYLRDFSYRGNYNIHHDHIRQLAWYEDLCGGGHRGQLYVTDHNGNHIIIEIPNSILRRAQTLNNRDVARLQATLESWKLFTTFGIPEELPPAGNSTNDPFESII